MNKKDDVLILLTSYFPYGIDNETFLYQELPVHCSAFHRVIILALGSIEPDIPIPIHSKVEVLVGMDPRIKGSANALHKIRIRIAPFLYKWYWREFFSNLTLNPAISFRKLYSLWEYSKGSFDKFLILRNLIPYLGLNPQDQVVIYSYWCDTSSVALCHLKKDIKKPNFKFYSRAHGFDLYKERQKDGYLPLRTYIAKHLDGFLPISQKGKNYLNQEYGVPLDKISVSYLGANAQEIEKKFLSSQIKILSAAGIIPLKRIDLIARGVLESAMTSPSTKIIWHHYGGGKKHIEEAIHKIMNILPSNCEYELKGWIPNSDFITRIINEDYDLIINASSSEGLPFSIIEAFSCGISAIATNVGGVSEIVTVKNGFLLSPNPTEIEISKAILNYENVDVKRNKSQESLNTFHELFSAQKNYKKLTELLKSE